MSTIQPSASGGTPPASENSNAPEGGSRRVSLDPTGYGRESVNMLSTSPESVSGFASPPQKGLPAFLSVGAMGLGSTLSDSQNSADPLPALAIGAGQAGGAGRVVAKTIDLVKWFNLPPQEVRCWQRRVSARGAASVPADPGNGASGCMGLRVAILIKGWQFHCLLRAVECWAIRQVSW